MKKKTFLRKLNFLIALGGVFAAVAFYGCGNLFSSIDSASDSPVNLAQPREGYGIVSGSLPSSESASARTAMPSKPDETALSFKVFAQSGSQRIEANVNDADRTFSLSLPFGTWEITANGMVADGRILFTQTQEVTLSEENATAFLRFELGYSTNPDDGDGEISLSVSFPPKDATSNATSLIRGIEYILSKGEEKIVQNVSDAELGAGNFKIGHATENLGAWHLTILFYGDFSNLVYRIDQTVNVYANLTTDTFEGSAPYISGGAIAVTQALLEDFQNTTLYVNATSGKDTNTGTQFDPLQTFNRALELVNNSTHDASTEFRIFLQTDVADGATLELNGGKKLTVASAGGTTRTITSLGRTFTVSSGSELTVQSVACKKLRFDVSGTFAMDGGEISGNTASNGGAICINAGGKATVANTKIYDNTANNKGGGVYVGGSANATLTNCAIKSCKTTSTTSTNGGGGIYSLGTLIVTGGTISDCIAGRSGGGIYAYGGTAECSGGVAFSGCKATGSGSFGSGGGICINKDVTVNVSDCTFVSCTANASGGGIWNAGELDVSNTSFTTCSANNNGGGVCNDGGTVTMSGTAKITGNNASGGGGVAVNSGTFTLENGTISNNTANNGGGVYVDGDSSASSSFTMKDGTISDNTAKGVDGESFGGGGIYLYRMTTSMPGGTFTLKGGTVSGNEAEYGGGIWASSFSEFTMEGGTFSGNKSTENGNGAYVNPGCTFTMSGAAQFAEADNVYLCDSNKSLFATITVAGALTAASPVATITPSAYDLDRQVLSAGGVPIDSAVCAQFALTPDPDEPDAEWNIMPDSTGANGVLKTKIDVYVRGVGGWYDSSEYKDTATASDYNAGTLRAPLATIQKAIEKVLEQNDGADAYTIFVDGTLDGMTAAKLGDNGMADFSALDKNLTLTIKALPPTAKATLDGGARFDTDGTVTNAGIGKRVIYAKPTSGILNLTLENLVIKGGNSSNDNGGGVYVASGTVTIKDCEISGNTASENGGGVYVAGGSTFTMNGGTISGNTAGAKGGGIYNNGGTVKMKGCTITDCKAGGTSNDEGGGGIYNASGTLELTGVTITLDSDGTRAAYQGGGIFNAGTLAMTGGSITGGGRLSGNLYRHGGGIYNTGVLTIEGVTISNFYTGNYGGGIYNNNGETAADFVTIKDCIITDCGSEQVGSGICTYKGKLKLENVDIIGGTANTNTGIYCYMSKLTIIGGKIEGFKKAAILTSSSGELKMDGTTVSGNTSTSSCGGVDVHCPFEIKNCTITGNETKYWSNNQNGGGLYIGNCTGTITNTTISGNTASADGGGIYIFGTADVTITDCIIKDNTATTGGGGGIYIDDSTATLKMEGGEISGNTAGGDGGGVAVNKGTFTLENGTISGNGAAYGAGVHVNGGGKFTMTGGTISDNTADGKNDSGGGGIHLYDGTFEMSGGTVTSNTADGTDPNSGGGGIYIYQRNTNKFTMTGGTFRGNRANLGKGAFICKHGIYCGLLEMSGGARFESDNDVYLYDNAPGTGTAPTITVAGGLTAASPVATITPSAYTVGKQVLSKGGSIPAITQDICGKFAVTYQYGTNWIIMPNDTRANGVLMTTNTVYLNASSGSDTNSGLTASKAVKTLSKAIELYDTYRSDKIMLCAEYTLANGENTLLNRAGAGKRALTLRRYDGSSDVSDVFTGDLLKITQGSVTITNVMVDSQNVSEECGRILWIEGETTTVTLGNNARLCYNKSKENGNVYIAAGTFKMEDGSQIYSNTAEYGGGVQVNGGTFEMSGGEITNNKAKSGAGVYVGDGTFTMSGTAEIRSNIADYGGGLYINSGTFTMSSGKITNNTAKSGGGVYNRVTFTISGGEITGNKANISPNRNGVTGTFTNTGGTVQAD